MELKHPMRRTVPGMVSTVDRAMPWLCGIAITLAALIVRLHGLGKKPYWMDEVTTLRRASLDLGALVRDSLVHHHLPLYFIISALFVPHGLDAGIMRLPSALFGALSCLILFLVGRSLAGWRCGLAAALLLCFSPFQVQYAQEARSYTLVTSFILLALWGLIRVARAPRTDRVGWLLYAAGTALALDTLSVSLFWLAGAQICAVLIARSDPAQRTAFVRRWLLVQAAILATYLPFVVAMSSLTHGDMGSGLDWVPPPTAHTIWTTIQSVYLLRISSLIAFRIFPGPLDLGSVPWFGFGVALLAVLGLASMRRSLSGRIVAVAFAILPIGLALASLRSSLWMPRYLLWSGPIFFLLAGTGVARLPRRAGMVALVAIGLLGLLNLRPYYKAETRPLWNVAAVTLRDALRPDDLIMTDDPGTIAMMNVTLAKTGRTFGLSDWTDDAELAMAAHDAGRRVWVLHGTVGQNDPYRLDTLLDRVNGLGAPASRRAIGLDIVLLLYLPANQDASRELGAG